MTIMVLKWLFRMESKLGMTNMVLESRLLMVKLRDIVYKVIRQLSTKMEE
jgi:hypothetical protein